MADLYTFSLKKKKKKRFVEKANGQNDTGKRLEVEKDRGNNIREEVDQTYLQRESRSDGRIKKEEETEIEIATDGKNKKKKNWHRN